MSIPHPWSYSFVKSFESCPKKVYEIKVAKNFKEPDNTDATALGTAFHEAAELYVRDGTPLPDKFKSSKTLLDNLVKIPGDKYVEHEMGLTKHLEPCGFRDENVWCRGIADLLIVNEATASARCLDYKTSKSTKYADMAQLELMSLMVFKHFPKIKTVKTALLFVVCGELKKDQFTVDRESAYWRLWMARVARIETAYKTGVWNANRTGLCKKHCVVTTCPHNGAYNG